MFLVGFSDDRASFQLGCFTFVRMAGSAENNGIWGSLNLEDLFLKI